MQVDLNEEKPSPRVFTIAGLNPPKPVAVEEEEEGQTPVGIELKPQKITAGKPLKLEVTLRYPDEFKLNKEAPVRAKVTAKDSQLVNSDALKSRIRGAMKGDVASFEIPLNAKPGKTVLQVAVSYGYCRGGTSGFCKLHTARWSIPVEIVSDGTDSLKLRTDIPQ